MTSDGNLRPATDDAARSWIRESLGAFASGVRSIVPPVFKAYARILHPARASDGTPVRWATVAAWAGGTVHALAEFEPLARQREPRSAPAPFAALPTDGALAPATVDDLCDVLGRYTATPDRCSFGLWEGYGWIDWMAPDRQRAARLGLPNRTYLLFEGPLGSVVDLGWSEVPAKRLLSRRVGLTERAGSFVRKSAIGTKSRRPRTASIAALHRESPNLMWASDRSWFVASEIDLDSTFVGGSMALVEELIGDGRFEAWRASPDNPVTADSDSINRGVVR
jgi:hypothetical protein